MPGFLALFIVASVISSTGVIPDGLADVAADVEKILLHRSTVRHRRLGARTHASPYRAPARTDEHGDLVGRRADDARDPAGLTAPQASIDWRVSVSKKCMFSVEMAILISWPIRACDLGLNRPTAFA